MDFVAANMNLAEFFILVVLSVIIFLDRDYRVSSGYWATVIIYITLLRRLFAPETEIESPQIIGYLLNVVFFIPFGFCCSRMRIKDKAIGRKSIAAGCVLSLLVETVQGVTALGCFDVLDILCNTAGAAAGYGISRVLRLQ